MLRLLVLMSLLLGPTAGSPIHAQPCARVDPTALLDSTATRLVQHHFERTDTTTALETAILPDGITVRIEHSGCDRFRLTWHFTVPTALVSASDTAVLPVAAAILLDDVPTVAVLQPLVERISALLRNAAEREAVTLGEPIADPNGAATITVTARAVPPNQTEVTVAYDARL